MEERQGVLTVDSGKIQNLVYTIRGQQVMLDSDLADLYGYEVKRLNEQVRRNINRFPSDFMFQLTQDEAENLKSQNATSSWGGKRKLPYVFTEQGIYMLATVLRGELAEKQSIYIMRAFREMRHFIANNTWMFERIRGVELKQLEYQKQSEEKFTQIFDYISEHEESMQKIFFNGQIFDAFSLFTTLINQAEQQIILVDGYVDVATLNILAKKKAGVTVIIYTFPGTKITKKDIDVFNAQYPMLTVEHTTVFHDRFLILDSRTGYHIGASLKDAGQKCFGINKIEDEKVISELLGRVECKENNSNFRTKSTTMQKNENHLHSSAF